MLFTVTKIVGGCKEIRLIVDFTLLNRDPIGNNNVSFSLCTSKLKDRSSECTR